MPETFADVVDYLIPELQRRGVFKQDYSTETYREMLFGRGPRGSLRGGQRAAAVMSLIQSAKLNGHDPYAYLKDVLERLPTQPASRIEELLPHRWVPTA
jgi:hypothetical protein